MREDAQDRTDRGQPTKEVQDGAGIAPRHVEPGKILQAAVPGMTLIAGQSIVFGGYLVGSGKDVTGVHEIKLSAVRHVQIFHPLGQGALPIKGIPLQ